MWAMVLCAGRGDRMRPLTHFTPKPLLTVAGEPLLQRHLLAIASAGISDVMINVHHLGQQIQSFVGDGRRFGLRVAYCVESQLLETAGGIANALMNREGANGSDDLAEPFLVVSGDVYSEMDLSLVVAAAHREMNDFDPSLLGSLVMVPNPPHHPNGDFGLDPENRLTMDGERLTYGGVGVFSPAFFADAPVRPSPLRNLLFPAIRDRQLAGALYRGVWEDVGVPDRLRRLSDDIYKQRRRAKINAARTP